MRHCAEVRPAESDYERSIVGGGCRNC